MYNLGYSSLNVANLYFLHRSVGGIFKEVAVIFLSMFIFHDQLTPINISGLSVTLFGELHLIHVILPIVRCWTDIDFAGIGLYNYLKYSQFTQGGGDSRIKKPGFEPLGAESSGSVSIVSFFLQLSSANTALSLSNSFRVMRYRSKIYIPILNHHTL